MNNISRKNDYKYIYFIAVLYMTFMSLPAVLAYKLIASPIGLFSAASLISPFWFMIGDIIAEVYGYKISKHLFWSTIICQLFFACSCYLIIKLPSPVSWHGTQSYELVTGHLVRIALFSLFGNIIAWKMNIYLLLHWKLLMRGNYFWLRSFFSSAIGEIIFSVSSITLILFGTFPLKQIISIVVGSCLLKIIGLIILTPIANYIVILLKHVEKPIENDVSVTFNPFK